MPVEDVNDKVDTPVTETKEQEPAEEQEQAQEQRPREDPAPARKIPDRLLWIATGIFIVLAIHIYLQTPRPHPPAEARDPEGLRFESVSETQNDKGMWMLKGTARAGPCNLAVLQYAVQYVDGQDNVVTQALLDIRDLKAGGVLEFEVQVEGYTPGLTRRLVPVYYARPGD